jgi:hypothetical protein
MGQLKETRENRKTKRRAGSRELGERERRESGRMQEAREMRRDMEGGD